VNVQDALNLESKPIDRFANDPGQFTKILKAEKDGLLTLTIGYDPSYVEDLKREFCGLFVSEGTTDVADQWNAQRKLIMEKVIDLLVPLFLKEVRTKLKKESDEQIINNCAGWLEGALLAGPYKASHTDEEADPIRIMAIARSESAYCCLLRTTTVELTLFFSFFFFFFSCRFLFRNDRLRSTRPVW
jgi:transcription elongation factor SPT6